VAREELEQVELAAGEPEVAPGAPRDPRARVELDVADGQRARRRGAPAQQRVQPGGDLLDGERLDDVVVGALLQREHAVVDLVAGRQHADGDVVAVAAQAPQDLHPVEVGHAQVEQDDRRVDLLGGRERRAPARRRDDLEALELEPRRDRLADRRVVVDEQHDLTGAGRRVSHG
jgi:hypothetical protein